MHTPSASQPVSQLFLVSDYSLTVTSTDTHSAQQFNQIKAQASFGVWPFFSASASATHTTDYTQNADGSLTVVYALPKGKIQIWGVSVQDAPS